jgi:hypothetical protein
MSVTLAKWHPEWTTLTRWSGAMHGSGSSASTLGIPTGKHYHLGGANLLKVFIELELLGTFENRGSLSWIG